MTVKQKGGIETKEEFGSIQLISNGKPHCS